MTLIKVLSVDGGGIKGIIPATVLAYIEERTGRPICALFDLIAGTSTGGILALGSTKPTADGSPQYCAEDGVALRMLNSPTAFVCTKEAIDENNNAPDAPPGPSGLATGNLRSTSGALLTRLSFE